MMLCVIILLCAIWCALDGMPGLALILLFIAAMPVAMFGTEEEG